MVNYLGGAALGSSKDMFGWAWFYLIGAFLCFLSIETNSILCFIHLLSKNIFYLSKGWVTTFFFSVRKSNGQDM
jgi:hypothetical protein